MNTSRTAPGRRTPLFCVLAASATLLSGCERAPKGGTSDPGADQGQSLTDRIADGVSSVFGVSALKPIKGLSLGMPITEAVAVMNAEAGPIWAATLGKQTQPPFKVVRVSGEKMAEIRLQLIQLVSAATMQLYRVDPADTRDIFIVVPSTTPDNPDDLKAVGLNVLQSVLFTGFFAWAGPDGRVNLFIIGPTLCNALFDASFMPMDQFADKFKSAYDIPKWQRTSDPDAGELFLYESGSGPGVALAEDGLLRRTVVVWDSTEAPSVGEPGKGDFD